MEYDSSTYEIESVLSLLSSRIKQLQELRELNESSRKVESQLLNLTARLKGCIDPTSKANASKEKRKSEFKKIALDFLQN